MERYVERITVPTTQLEVWEHHMCFQSPLTGTTTFRFDPAQVTVQVAVTGLAVIVGSCGYVWHPKLGPGPRPWGSSNVQHSVCDTSERRQATRNKGLF